MTRPIIIANGIVLTCDVSNRCGQLHLVVSGGKIADISERLDVLMQEYPNADVVDASNKLVVPGFVNAHSHGESFLFRHATKGMHFSLWKNNDLLRQAYSRFLDNTSNDDVRRVYHAAYLAHLKSGTTCVGEFGPPLDEEGFRMMSAGISASGVTPVFSLQNWDQIRTIQSLPLRSKTLLSLGAEEDYTVYRFEQLSKAAKEMEVAFLAHVAETGDAVDVVHKNFQRGCLTLLNSFNVLRQNTVVVHANFVSDEEVQLINNVGGTVVVCARSTAQKQTGYPALRYFAQRYVRCCLGTDWGSTDMFDEMRFVYQLPLVVAGLRSFSAVEVLRMATINGAFALGLSHDRGSIEVNKRADLSFLNMANIGVPILDLKSQAEDWSELLVSHLTSSDVSDVMIGGSYMVRNREFVDHREAEIVEQIRLVHRKYFPTSELLPHPSLPSVSEKTTLLPFFDGSRTEHEPSSGFESGFAPSDRSSTIREINEKATPVNPLLNLPKVKREPMKPELPKNTRRVFGDDEDI